RPLPDHRQPPPRPRTGHHGAEDRPRPCRHRPPTRPSHHPAPAGWAGAATGRTRPDRSPAVSTFRCQRSGVSWRRGRILLTTRLYAVRPALELSQRTASSVEPCDSEEPVMFRLLLAASL